MTQINTTKRFITSIFPIISYAIDNKIEPYMLMEGTRLNEKDFLDANTPIDIKQEIRIIRNLSAKCPHHELPWDLGRYYHAKAHGLIGSIILNAPTFGDAYEFVIEYLSLSHLFFKIHSESTPQIIRVYPIANDLPSDMIPFFIERDFAAVLATMETFAPGKKNKILKYVSFSHAPRTDVSKYQSILFKNIKFNQPSTFLEIYKSAMSIPIPGSNKQAFELLCQQCKAEYYLRGGKQVRFSDKVLLFLQAEKGNIKFTEIADNMHINEKSLRRHLQKEGTSFRKIKKDYTLHQAVMLLKNSSIGIEEISEKLGYSETCAFTRAFQRQTGISPSQYRKNHME